MTAQITDHDRLVYEEKRQMLCEEAEPHMRYRRKDSEPELLDEAVALWKKGEPFFLTGVVVAPYDGCFHEPQIWWVEPNCDEPLETVKPLYASGQSLGVDIVWCLGDLLTWLAEQSLSPVLMQDDRVSPRCAEHHMLSPSGRFDSFEVHAGDTLLSDLPPSEHYWAHAAKTASSKWSLDLKWQCGKCEQVIEGGEYECEPVFTGYRGNGGIGVFMEGVLCHDCAQQGMCNLCAERYDYHEAYDPDVAEYGWHLCMDHTKQVFEGLLEAVDGVELNLPEIVWLRKSPKDGNHVVFVDEHGEVLPVDFREPTSQQDVADLLSDHDVRDGGELLDDTEYGLQLPGRAVEYVAEQ